MNLISKFTKISIVVPLTFLLLAFMSILIGGATFNTFGPRGIKLIVLLQNSDQYRIVFHESVKVYLDGSMIDAKYVEQHKIISLQGQYASDKQPIEIVIPGGCYTSTQLWWDWLLSKGIYQKNILTVLKYSETYKSYSANDLKQLPMSSSGVHVLRVYD